MQLGCYSENHQCCPAQLAELYQMVITIIIIKSRPICDLHPVLLEITSSLIHEENKSLPYRASEPKLGWNPYDDAPASIQA